MSKSGDGATASKGKFSWAQTARDIGVAAVNRGQLLVLGVMVLTGIALWRMPESDVGILMLNLESGLMGGGLVGWGAAVIALVAWYSHTKYLRKRQDALNKQLETQRKQLISAPGGTK